MPTALPPNRVNSEASFGKPRKRLTHLPGQFIMQIEEGAVMPHLGGASVRMTRAGARRLPDVVSGPLESLRKNVGLKEVRPLFSTRRAALARVSGVPAAVRHNLAALTSVADSESEELRGLVVAEVDPKESVSKVLSRMKGAKSIKYAEPMPARWALAKGSGGTGTVDPSLNMQWGLRAIRWFNATRPEADGVRVGVIDSGIDETHPDLKDVVETYDHKGTAAADVLGHGTHVAGIIAAIINNGHGIAGVADCPLVVWKVFDDEPWDDGEFYVDGERYLQALRAMEAAGVVCVNLSIGGGGKSRTEALLFRRLADRGVLPIAAMGNEFEDGNPTSYPAAYDGVLAVGSTTAAGVRSWFSNTGDHIAVCAPGSGILSTVPMKRSAHRRETKYASWDGTSMATPHVSGLVALLKAKEPSLTPDELTKRVRGTAAKLEGMKGKAWTNEYGSGLIDVEAALR